MNKHHITASLAALLLGASAFAQNWYDAATLPLYGKARQDTKELYERLPAEFEGRSREPFWAVTAPGSTSVSPPTLPRYGSAGARSSGTI